MKIFTMNTSTEQPQESAAKRPFKRMHQDRCGVSRRNYDSYEDVRLACEHKLREWELQGIIPPWLPMNSNDWLFRR